MVLLSCVTTPHFTVLLEPAVVVCRPATVLREAHSTIAQSALNAAIQHSAPHLRHTPCKSLTCLTVCWLCACRWVYSGEVDNPSRTFPRALLWAVLLVVASYFLPTLAALGVTVDSSDWELGYYGKVAQQVGALVVQLRSLYQSQLCTGHPPSL